MLWGLSQSSASGRCRGEFWASSEKVLSKLEVPGVVPIRFPDKALFCCGYLPSYLFG